MQKTNHSAQVLCRLAAPVKHTMACFIAGENQAAISETQKLQERLAALCGDDLEFSSAFWEFEVLRSEELRDRAATEATRAEMIIISLSSDFNLPAHVRGLLERLPGRRQAGSVALVMLVDGQQWTGE